MSKFWLINLVLFQSAWLVCAFLTPYATTLVAFILVVHFVLSPSPSEDGKLLVLAVIGIALDQLLLSFGVIFPDRQFLPLWLCLLWCIFAISLGYSLAWLKRLPLVGVAPIGAVAGASCYYAAFNLGAISTPLETGYFITAYAIVWLFVLPLFVYLLGHSYFHNSVESAPL